MFRTLRDLAVDALECAGCLLAMALASMILHAAVDQLRGPDEPAETFGATALDFSRIRHAYEEDQPCFDSAEVAIDFRGSGSPARNGTSRSSRTSEDARFLR